MTALIIITAVSFGAPESWWWKHYPCGMVANYEPCKGVRPPPAKHERRALEGKS